MKVMKIGGFITVLLKNVTLKGYVVKLLLGIRLFSLEIPWSTCGEGISWK